MNKSFLFGKMTSDQRAAAGNIRELENAGRDKGSPLCHTELTIFHLNLPRGFAPPVRALERKLGGWRL